MGQLLTFDLYEDVNGNLLFEDYIETEEEKGLESTLVLSGMTHIERAPVTNTDRRVASST